MAKRYEGRIVDPLHGRSFYGALEVEGGQIAAVRELTSAPPGLITPVLVDAHVHVESSLLSPAEFARLAVTHGVAAAVCDPHEIANVCGVEGVRFMVENGARVPFRFFFGAPSCVPATPFETAGAAVKLAELEELLSDSRIHFLAEMMNWPGVLSRAPQEMAKIALARRLNKVVDGHAPGLCGDDARRYIEAGITTDHECCTLEEARDKVRCGMKVSIREGSAAKNFEALIPLLAESCESVMFCTDDAHPNYLRERYLDDHVRRALTRGIDALKVFRAASVNPVKHYGLDVGLLQPGDRADFVIADEPFNVREVFIGGERVAAEGESLLPRVSATVINRFTAEPITAPELVVRARSGKLRAIRVIPNELLTAEEIVDAPAVNGAVPASAALHKLAVKNRYAPAPAALAFVRGFGLERGALASSIAHDSHNVIGIGASDDELLRAMNLVIAARGGLALVNGSAEHLLPLRVAGLMSDDDAFRVSDEYDRLDRLAREALRCPLPAPFMSLSFLALLVIPALKLSDRGLFDGRRFEFVDLFV